MEKWVFSKNESIFIMISHIVNVVGLFYIGNFLTQIFNTKVRLGHVTPAPIFWNSKTNTFLWSPSFVQFGTIKNNPIRFIGFNARIELHKFPVCLHGNFVAVLNYSVSPKIEFCTSELTWIFKHQNKLERSNWVHSLRYVL